MDHQPASHNAGAAPAQELSSTTPTPAGAQAHAGDSSPAQAHAHAQELSDRVQPASEPVSAELSDRVQPADARAVLLGSAPSAQTRDGNPNEAKEPNTTGIAATNMPAHTPATPGASLGNGTAGGSFGIGSGLKIPQFTTGSKLGSSASLFSTSSSLLGRPLGAQPTSGPQLRPVMLQPTSMPLLGHATNPSTVNPPTNTTSMTTRAPHSVAGGNTTTFPKPQSSRLGGAGSAAFPPPPFPSLSRGIMGTGVGSMGFCVGSMGTPMSRTSVLSSVPVGTPMSNPHRLSQVSSSPGHRRNPISQVPGGQDPSTDGIQVGKKVIITNVDTRLLSLESEFNGDFTVNGKPLILDVDKPTTPANTGFRVWDAGIVMSKYFEHLHSEQKTFIKKKVLELGCGSGIGGLSFALLGHDVFLTDQPEIQSRTQKNIMSNAAAISQAGGHATFQVLDWNQVDKMHGLGPGNEFGTFDIVIASDVIWANSFIKPFLQTLRKVTTETTKIYMGHKTRSEEIDTNFMDALSEFGFELAETILPHDVIDHKYSLQKVSIYVFRHKPAEAPEDSVEKAENKEGSQPEAAAQETHENPEEKASSNDDVGAELGED